MALCRPGPDMPTGHLSSGLSIQGCHIVHSRDFEHLLAQQILAREEALHGQLLPAIIR
jgi:hypothetical protein